MLGVQNIYNQKNAYSLYFSKNDDGSVTMKKLTLFPVMPSVSYSYKF